MRRFSFDDIQTTLVDILLGRGLTPSRAETCARIFVENSRDGVYSHGLNRFPAFVEFIDKGYVQPRAEPVLSAAFGAWEQWDGRLGPGPLNALTATNRALTLAAANGIGCVGLHNTNHWMRGGTYGWQAAESGYGFICWTNTTPNMPPWGGVERRLGNNPLVLAVPGSEGPVVLDMAMTQYSLGRIGIAAARGETLDVPGGYDGDGRLTRDAAAIEASERPLPIGYWKGAGLALLLDLLGALVAGGQTTVEIGRQVTEFAVCQVFIAFDLNRQGIPEELERLVKGTIADLHSAAPADPTQPVRYPGERALQTRLESMDRGVAVDPDIWDQILALR